MKKTATLLLLLCCALFAAAQPQPPRGIKPVTNPGTGEAKAPVVTDAPPEPLEITFIPFTDTNGHAADSTTIPIILAYMRLNEPDIDAAGLNEYFTRHPNPFLQSLVNDITAKGKGKTDAEVMPSLTGVQGGGGLNLFPATQIVDGLGTFLAERFKKELTLAYLDQMKKQLENADSLYAVSALLPETYSTFSHLEDVFNYKIYLNTIKEAVKVDIGKLPDQVIVFADSLYRKKALGNMSKEDFYLSLYSTYLFKESAFNGRNLLSQFMDAKNNTMLAQIDTPSNAKDALLFLSALTGSFQLNPGFMGPEELKTLRLDSNMRKMYLGLSLEKMRADIAALKFTVTKDGNAATLSGPDVYIALGQDIQAFFTLMARFDRVRSDLEAIQNAYQQRDSSDKIALFMATLRDFQLLLQQLQQIPGNGILQGYPAKVSKALQLADETLQLAQYVKNKQSGLAINQLLEIMDSLNISKTTDAYRFIEKYGPFMATLADAQSGDEVAAALESAAMPVGSYRVKHHYRQNISIQAYVGGAGGAERMRVNNTTGWKGVAAFSAPIGIAWSFTSLKKNNDYELKGYTSTLFFSLLDIGAVTALRIADTTTALPELSFKNVLAPGFYYVGSCKKAPICFGVGVQYGPELRKVESGNAVLNASAWRVGGFLSVDIPVFNIYNRGGKRK